MSTKCGGIECGGIHTSSPATLKAEPRSLGTATLFLWGRKESISGCERRVRDGICLSLEGVSNRGKERWVGERR